MNQKTIERTKELLILLMNHLFYMATALMLLGLTGYKNDHILLWISLIIVPYFFYFVHAFVQNSFLLVVLHLIVPCIALVMNVTIPEKVMMMIIIGFYISFSLLKMLTALLPPKAFTPLIAFFLLVETFHTQNGWQIYYLIAAILYLVCYVISYFLSQYTNFITLNNYSASNIPEQEILYSGIKRTCFFTAICVLAAIPFAASGWFAGIIAKTRDVFLSLAKTFIFWLQTLDVEQAQKSDGGSSESIYQSLQALDNNEKMYNFWKSLEQLLPPIMIIFAIIGIVFLIRLVYRFWKEHYHKRRAKKPAEILSNQDLREKCDIDTMRSSESRIFSFMDNRSKIRKIYKKRMIKGQTELIGDRNVKELEYMTAKECCEKLSEDNLKQVYEKAKYSPEEITAADVKMAKTSE